MYNNSIQSHIVYNIIYIVICHYDFYFLKRGRGDNSLYNRKSSGVTHSLHGILSGIDGITGLAVVSHIGSIEDGLNIESIKDSDDPIINNYSAKLLSCELSETCTFESYQDRWRSLHLL